MSVALSAEWLPRVRAGHVHARLLSSGEGSVGVVRETNRKEEHVAEAEKADGDIEGDQPLVLETVPRRGVVRVRGAFGDSNAGVSSFFEHEFNFTESGIDLARFLPQRSAEKGESPGAESAELGVSIRLTPAGNLTDLPGRVKYDAFLFDRPRALSAVLERASVSEERGGERLPNDTSVWCAHPFACRRCADAAKGSASVPAVVSFEGSEWVVKALPSENWLEIADSWLCGCACSDGVTEFAHLTLSAVVPRTREVLVGDTHILVDSDAVRRDSVKVCFDERFRPAVPISGATSAGGEAGQPHAHAHAHDDTRSMRQWLVPLKCTTCESVLGTLPLRVGGSAVGGLISADDVPSDTLPLGDVPGSLVTGGLRLYYFALAQPTLDAQNLGWLKYRFTVERAVAGMLLACLQVQQAPLVEIQGFSAPAGGRARSLRVRLLSKDVYALQDVVDVRSLSETSTSVAFEPVVKVAFADSDGSVPPESAGLEIDHVWLPHDAVDVLREVLERSNSRLPPRAARIPIAGFDERPRVAYLRCPCDRR
jgi:HECT-like Ubiquitin-conjugating enzyme (E2)-binding